MEGKKDGSEEVHPSKKFSFAPPEAVRDDMKQSKLMRTGYLESTKSGGKKKLN